MTPHAVGIQQVDAEAAGVLDVYFISSSDAAQLTANAMLGDPRSAALLAAVADSWSWIKHAAKTKPALCMSCPREIRGMTSKTVFGVAMPARSDPRHALAFAFCDSCGEHRDDLLANATTGLRLVWPQLRPFHVTHEAGGRA
jgi:hypothetical protein